MRAFMFSAPTDHQDAETVRIIHAAILAGTALSYQVGSPVDGCTSAPNPFSSGRYHFADGSPVAVQIVTDDELSILFEMTVSSNPVEQHNINEMLTRALAHRVIQAGQTVFDVGANRGFHAFAFASAVGPSGLVHAFEPNPAHWPDLSRHENIRLWPVAAGDRQSVETFFFPENHDGAASLHDPRDFLGADWKMTTLTVVQVRIDDLPEATAAPVSFVKIDVERHEFEALMGMRELLKRDRPIVVLENATDPIREFFRELSYRPEFLTAGLWPARDTNLPNTAFLPDEADAATWLPTAEMVVDTVRGSRLLPA